GIQKNVSKASKGKEKVEEGKGKEKVVVGNTMVNYRTIRDQLLKTNPGSTVKLDVDKVLGGKTYFKSQMCIYVDVALKDGWNEGCKKVTGLDRGGSTAKGWYARAYPLQHLSSVRKTRTEAFCNQFTYGAYPGSTMKINVAYPKISQRQQNKQM
ncbi:hypothetical protein Tco_1350483, partial [Tanacetum coccineum]